MKTRFTLRMQILTLCPMCLLVLSGCESHLAFGTATTFGLDISATPDQSVNVVLGYERAEVASIPAYKEPDDQKSGDQKNPQEAKDATQTEDVYSVLGTFRVAYGNPWTNEPLNLSQLFATGLAARKVAMDPEMRETFGKAAGTIRNKAEKQAEGGGDTP